MKIKFSNLVIIVLFLIIFLIFFKGLKNSNIYEPNDIYSKSIPFFKTKLFDQELYISSDEIFKDNKFYLVNIWASWCIPCRDEHPVLLDLNNLDTMEIVGLNYKDNTQNAKSFLKELGNPYKLILSDKDGVIAIEWGAYGVPESFLIQNKKVVKRFIGPLNTDSLIEIKNFIK